MIFSRFLLAALAVATASASSLDEQFNNFMIQYHKHYTSEEELQTRKQIFANTLERIEELRALEPDASFGINKFADLTPEEMKAMYMGYRPMGNSAKVPISHHLDMDKMPKAFDWRTTAPYPVTAVKNQGQCGSCWAFSATEGVESARIMQHGKSEILAPQEIVSCDHVDQGCNGGDLPTAFSFVESLDTHNGLTENALYPYTSGTTGVTGTCQTKREKKGFTEVQKAAFAVPPCSTLADASCSGQAKKEPQLAQQLMTHGPISICVDASPWQTYTGGILKSAAQCPGGQMDLDHCVQLVGFNTEKKDDGTETSYWIVRNSWATDWGEKGFIYLEMGKNICGVADEPMFATDNISAVAAKPASLTVDFVGAPTTEVFVDASSHYEDPNSGACQTGEEAVRIQGVQGSFCSPKCAFLTHKCPTDVPQGVTAKPTCALQGMGAKYCALICSPSTDERSLRAGDAQCGASASCKAIQGTGICTYDK
jgi:C1A family cysteine protease